MSTPTQQDIADALGVSKMTVSLALRHSPEVSQEMRERVAAAAQAMGYQINAHARGLAARRVSAPSGLPIALLNLYNPPSEWHRHLSFRHMREGAEKRAGELGYRLDEISLRERGMTARRVDQILKSRGIRGVLIPPSPHSHGHLRLSWDQFAAAAIGFTFRRPNLHRTAHNSAMALQLTLHHLKHFRYRRVGLLLSRAFSRRADSIPEAIFLYHQRETPVRDHIPILWSNWDTFPEALPAWLERHRPDVLLTHWPEVFLWLRQKGYDIPGDLGFVSLGWHDEIKSELGLEPTGISIDNRELGARAVEMIVGQMERHEYGVPVFPTITLVTPRWIPGETVRARG